jgi:hypothetical protein
MLSNKDIKEMVEARKARRAVPQVDPADVVSPPEPTTPPPAPPAQRTDSQPKDAELPPLAIEEPPQLEAVEPAPATPLLQPPAGIDGDDPRTQAPPPDDIYVPKTVRVKSHRERQLRAEAYHRDLLIQDIIETALNDYFRKRYGRPQRQ